MLEVKLIIGSTREGRAADLVSPWVIRSLKAREGLSIDRPRLKGQGPPDVS